MRIGRQLRPAELERQTLWLCRWGTMAALVWAHTAENAELRIRHRVYDRRASTAAIEAEPIKVQGEVIVRRATRADIAEFEEAGGRVPA